MKVPACSLLMGQMPRYTFDQGIAHLLRRHLVTVHKIRQSSESPTKVEVSLMSFSYLASEIIRFSGLSQGAEIVTISSSTPHHANKIDAIRLPLVTKSAPAEQHNHTFTCFIKPIADMFAKGMTSYTIS